MLELEAHTCPYCHSVRSSGRMRRLVSLHQGSPADDWQLEILVDLNSAGGSGVGQVAPIGSILALVAYLIYQLSIH